MYVQQVLNIKGVPTVKLYQKEIIVGFNNLYIEFEGRSLTLLYNRYRRVQTLIGYKFVFDQTIRIDAANSETVQKECTPEDGIRYDFWTLILRDVKYALVWVEDDEAETVIFNYDVR